MSRIKKELTVKPDWGKVRDACKESGWTVAQICSILGKSPKWLADGYKRDSVTDVNTLNSLATLLKVEPSELTEKIEEQKDEQMEEPKPERKTSDVAIMHKIMEVEAKVDRIVELLAKLSEPKKTVEDGRLKVKEFSNKPKNELAKMLLRELIDEGWGKCTMTTFQKELLRLNIPSSYAEQAVKDCGYAKGTTGLGQNTSTWILSKTWEGENNGKQI